VSMRCGTRAEDQVFSWDIALPARPSRTAGVRMAGFCDRGALAVDLRVIPHPAVMLALDLGPGSLVVAGPAGEHRGSFVAGLGTGRSGAVRVRGRNFGGVQVRLSPLIARAVLGVAPADLDGAVVSLEGLWGRQASRLAEQLSDLSSWAERFTLTDALLARRAVTSYPDPEVAWAWHRIVASGGLVRVESLAAEIGWSRKRLWGRFQSQLGLPPKRAVNLVRFDRAVHRLAAGDAPARVAADSGYADQSHLHRDVMALTGTTLTTVADDPWLAVDDIAWSRPAGGTPRPGSAAASLRRAVAGCGLAGSEK
jgi:AraC-like DNA-binding protein